MHVTWCYQLIPKLNSVKKPQPTNVEVEKRKKWIHDYSLACQEIHELGGWAGFQQDQETLTAEWEYWFRPVPMHCDKLDDSCDNIIKNVADSVNIITCNSSNLNHITNSVNFDASINANDTDKSFKNRFSPLLVIEDDCNDDFRDDLVETTKMVRTKIRTLLILYILQTSI